MRRILPFLALFFCAIPLRATSTISYVSGCTPNAGTSCTLASAMTKSNWGNLMVAVAYRSNSATAPTLATGWTSAKSTTGNTNAIRIGWKLSNGTETTCGTWANATATDCRVYSGNDVHVGTTTSGTTGSSTTISDPTFTLTQTNGSSWVACANGAATATNVDAAPSGLTLRSGTTLDNYGFVDTNGGVTSFAAHTLTVSPTGVWASACIEILSAFAGQGVSGITSQARHSYWSTITSEPCTSPCDFTIPVHPPASGANNFLRVVWTWSYASTAPTVSNIYCNSDTGHATWTFTQAADSPVLDTGDDTDAFDYYIDGAAAGCTSVTIVAATALWNNMAAAYDEYSGIATSGAVDTAVGQLCSGCGPASATSGALTTGTSGDVISMFCTQAGLAAGFNTSTNIFAPAGATFRFSDIGFAIADYSLVQTTAGAITPYMNIVGVASGQNFICMSMALKTSAGAGTVPTGVDVISQANYTNGDTTPTNFQLHILNANDAVIIVGNNAIGGMGAQWSSISDLLGNSLTSYQNSGSNPNTPAFAVVCTALAGDDYFTLAGTANGGNGTYTALEVTGLTNSSATACVDSTVGYDYANGTTWTTTSTYAAAPNLTPAVTNELILAQINWGTGPGTAVTAPTGALYDYPLFTGETDLDFQTEGGAMGYLFAPNTNAESWTWTNTNNASWGAAAMAFLPASGGGTTIIPALPLLGVGVGDRPEPSVVQ